MRGYAAKPPWEATLKPQFTPIQAKIKKRVAIGERAQKNAEHRVRGSGKSVPMPGLSKTPQ